MPVFACFWPFSHRLPLLCHIAADLRSTGSTRIDHLADRADAIHHFLHDCFNFLAVVFHLLLPFQDDTVQQLFVSLQGVTLKLQAGLGNRDAALRCGCQAAGDADNRLAHRSSG